MATKITTPELFNLSSNNTAATQLPVFTTSTRPTPTTSTVQVEYLVIGGGGAGGAWGGGGGAGGYLTNYGGSKTPLTSSVNYAIVVGEGGIKQADSGSRIAANAGEDSSIIGTGISVVANGGGGGGGMLSTSTTAEYPAQNGGSGGGASSMRNASVGGSGNTPSTTPSQGNDGGDSPAQDPNYPGGGGGGGAGSLGGDGQNSSGNYSPGNGGNGLASSITGTSVTRAGGGGGFLYGGPNTATDGGISTGGTGGGGAGGRYVSPSNGSLSSFSNAIDGEVNTGSGGGSGSANPYQSGSIKYGGSTASGGSGIVILRYPTSSSPNIKTTGSLVYTESTDGSDTVIQFTEGSGNVSFASAGIAVGEMIFNSTTEKVEYWDGFQWTMIKDEAVDYTSNLLTWIDVGPGKSWSGSGSSMTDLSGNGNNFTLSGQSYTAGNNYVTLPNSSAYATSDISMTYNVPKTLLMWHKISINSGYSVPFGTNSASYTSYILYGNGTGSLPDESVSTYTNYNTTNYVNGLVRNGHYAYTDNTWRMMALVEDTTNWPNNTLLFYMNGSLVSQSSTGKYWSVDKLAIGKLGSTASGVFFGDVGQWRVYSESLTANKILAIYNATKAAYGL